MPNRLGFNVLKYDVIKKLLKIITFKIGMQIICLIIELLRFLTRAKDFEEIVMPYLKSIRQL